MRRVALLLALSLIVTACGGGDDSATTSTGTPDGPDGDVTTTQARSQSPIEGAAASGDLVSVDYVGTLADGSEFDSSIGRGEPLQFTLDSGQMIQGFNDAVLGMTVGETKTVTLSPAEAYQDYNADRIVQVPLADLPEDITIGSELISPFGQRVVVVSIDDEFATIDENHPLAGETLNFEITLVSIDG